jgi:hypothetical protein
MFLKLTKVFSFFTFLSLIFVKQAHAICPVCTIAVGAGVGLSRYFGVDDTIAGVWIGGLTVSMIMWTINWFNKKNIKFVGRKIITTVAYYALIVVPLFYTGIMGHALNKIWGVDKLLIGIIFGSIFFFAFGQWYQVLKRKNGGKAYFPFQKVAMPVLPLVILTIIFYFITRR